MAQLRSSIRKVILLGAMSVASLMVFLVDVAFRRTGDLNVGWTLMIRDILVLICFSSFYAFIESLWRRDQNPSKKLGFAMVLTIIACTAIGSFYLLRPSGFDIKGGSLVPLGFDSLAWANVYSLGLGATSVIVLMILRDVIFAKRRKATRRNFLIFLILLILTVLSTLGNRSTDSTMITSLLTGLTILAMVVNSFRLTWIVFLTKREKVFNLMYGFILLLLFVALDVVTSRGSAFGLSLLFYSAQVQVFIWHVALFATIYFGMTFVSTLFHLPTAEAYDRKRAEVSSIHNLGKLVTQVFDFNELADSVTALTMEVCEASGSWLEIISEPLRGKPGGEISVAAFKNIPRNDIDLLMQNCGDPLRKEVVATRKVLVIDNVRGDKRIGSVPAGLEQRFSSLAVVPLVSHESVIGILYATKSMEYGFDRDDVEILSTFADQATIAVENSRLIGKSLERERLMREMMLAQEMQRKLLPQALPSIPELELEALSTPAFEVGGDYYDFTLLDKHHLAVLVGDVSGKGISAAFYMAEMKGIFQSLSRIYREPKDFLAKAHESLVGTIDRRSFISLLYAVLDLRTGIMTIARAGHCPMLHATNSHAVYVKPTGLGLGMGSNEFFSRTISQESIQLNRGDVAVLYTDGVTEARSPDGGEFGYERLQEVVTEASSRSAIGVRDAIIEDVDRHTNHLPPDDDLTIVVLKWMKA
jgi:phosphoserine phosphatase RsbU/P